MFADMARMLFCVIFARRKVKDHIQRYWYEGR